MHAMAGELLLRDTPHRERAKAACPAALARIREHLSLNHLRTSDLSSKSADTGTARGGTSRAGTAPETTL